jgi:hypothetical protein
MAFIEGNGVLTEAQHGFKTKKSTETALQIFIISTQQATKTNEPNWNILDLTKAYDVLNHKALLFKLNSYGIRGVANLWFESYPLHWKQCVEINSTKQGICVLTKRETGHGVPQGSILCPILFSLYINDVLPNIMGSKIVLVADDTNILVSDENINNLQYKLNNVTTELHTWFTLNSLVVNVDKMSAISFHTIQNSHCYHMLYLI